MPQPAILVTGGAGYIGSHTAKALAGAGYQPVVFDNLSNGHREAVRWGPFVHGDIRDRGALLRVMADHRIEAVIHFAGLIEVGASVKAPGPYWDHNVGGMAAVLGAMQEAGIGHLVFSSTAAVYGSHRPATGALRESDPTVPVNPYGDTKLACERMIAAHCVATGLSAVALRYFNASGADAAGDLGEAHSPETHLIPRAIEAALGVGPALTLFGDDFATPDGTCVRDYVHVTDLANAHVRAVTRGSRPGRFDVFNLGTGSGASVAEIIRAVQRATGRPVPFSTGPRRPGDPDRLVADPAAAAVELGWTPQASELDVILASAVRWRRRPAFGLAVPLDLAA